MSTFSDTFLAANSSKLPAETLPAFRERLAKLDESKSSAVLATDLKAPVTAFILSFFLGGFGVDRFYIGQTKLGAIKLGLILLYYITIWFGIGIILMPVLLWPLVDLFLIMGATKKVNAEKLNAVLATVE